MTDKEKKKSELVETAFFDKLKSDLKEDDFVNIMFDFYNVPITLIDQINMSFDPDLDVSAKTKGTELFFNTRLLEGEDSFEDDLHYVIHELVHFLQVVTRSIDKEENEKDYLENKNELDAFQVQILYKLLTEGPDEAKRYIFQVLNHHDVDEDELSRKTRDLAGDTVYKAL